MSGAKDIFDQFKCEALAHIQRAFDEGWSESEVLEFKQASLDRGPMQVIDRQNLAEALSGFANAEGGVLIWGLRADKQKTDEPDVVKELKPIRNLRSFFSDLQIYTPQIITPALVGVEHLEIPSGTETDVGYAVTFVPQAEGLPIMAIAKDQYRHYCRCGSSFIKMTAPMLADRYSRRPHPKLEFVWHISARNDLLVRHGTSRPVSITVGIRNVGRGIARFPALKIVHNERLMRSQWGLDGNGRDGLPRLPTESVMGSAYTSLHAGGSDVVIYPGTDFFVTSLSTTFQADNLPVLDLVFTYELHCEGFSSVREARIPGRCIQLGKGSSEDLE